MLIYVSAYDNELWVHARKTRSPLNLQNLRVGKRLLEIYLFHEVLRSSSLRLLEMIDSTEKGLMDYEAQMNVDMRRGFLSRGIRGLLGIEKVLVTVFLQLLITTGIVYAIWSSLFGYHDL